MAVDLLLHIGISKTGSTSIQRWLADARRPVRGDVYVPDATALPFTRLGNHKGLVLFAGSRSVWESGHAARLFKQMSVERDVDRAAFVRRYGEALSRCARTAAASGCRKLLLSNEHLSERLGNSDIISFTRRLRSSFSSLTLMVYLREQSKVYRSLYGEMVKHGSRLTLEEFGRTEWVHRRFDYYRLLTSWAKAGWIVRPRIYHESDDSPDHWDVVSDFADQVWPTPTDDQPIRAPRYRLNVSHHTETYQMVARINSGRLPRFVRRRLLSSLDRFPMIQRRIAARNEAVLRQIRARHAEGNRNTAREFFGREDLF